MTANNFKVGDAVRYKWDDRKQKYIVVFIKRETLYIAKNSMESYYGGVNKAECSEVEPWDDTIRCRYCGVEIVIDSKSTIAPYRDETAHKLPCPLANLESGYNTYQEAIEAYSMKGEG